jgi:polyphosphate glucokinase
MRILVLDVGGTHVKALVLNGPGAPGADASSADVGSNGDGGAAAASEPARIDSGPTLTPDQMVAGIKQVGADWQYDVISIGYPGPVVDGRPAVEPHNLAKGWVGYDFGRAFGREVRVINDAAMQALGGYQGGRMLFLGLGTGLGSALVIQGHLQPLELAHMPYKRGRTYEEYVGEAAREKAGNHKWRRTVVDVVNVLHTGMQSDSVLLGGGNARRLEKALDHMPPGTRLGSNADAMRGGVRLWAEARDRAGVTLDAGAEAAASAVTAPDRAK